jgi:poly(3-hydroxybutyrate) depolymerase
MARAFTDEHGFQNVRLRWLIGRKHGQFADAILDFFESIRTGAPEEEPPLPPVPDPIRVAELDPARAMETPQLVGALGHPMRYWVSLPRGWERSRVWPVLVTVEGSAGDFEGNARSFAEKRGDLPFIVVAPVVLSNAAIASPHLYPYPAELLRTMNRGGMKPRMDFDLTGLVTVLDEVRGLLRGSEKVFLTGYAGGGNLTWAMAFAHPARLAAAAPVSGCVWGPFERTAPRSDRSALEVRAFQGMQTSGIMTSISDGHWKKAKSTSDELGGFASVSRVQLEDVPHGRAYDAVLAFFASKLSAEDRPRPATGP